LVPGGTIAAINKRRRATPVAIENKQQQLPDFRALLDLHIDLLYCFPEGKHYNMS
jgi:hypothetical protein